MTHTGPMPDSAVSTAAKMAGDWWAELLADKYADRRAAFSDAVARRVEQELRGECYWDRHGEKKDGKGWGETPRCRIEFDYDPHNLLCEALAEAVPGMPFWEARHALPTKHDLDVYLDRLEPKEGYGNWTAHIAVPRDS